jgi:hypothetical protein
MLRGINVLCHGVVVEQLYVDTESEQEALELWKNQLQREFMERHRGWPRPGDTIELVLMMVSDSEILPLPRPANGLCFYKDLSSS